jgi:hypothetical protein
MSDIAEVIIYALVAIGMFILTIAFYGLIVLVVGYVILWLLNHFGILQHFGITMITGMLS